MLFWLLTTAVSAVFALEGVLVLDFEGNKLKPSALQTPPFSLGPSFTIEGTHCHNNTHTSIKLHELFVQAGLNSHPCHLLVCCGILEMPFKSLVRISNPIAVRYLNWPKATRPLDLADIRVGCFKPHSPCCNRCILLTAEPLEVHCTCLSTLALAFSDGFCVNG